jgi:hypothetical protein
MVIPGENHFLAVFVLNEAQIVIKPLAHKLDEGFYAKASRPKKIRVSINFH